MWRFCRIRDLLFIEQKRAHMHKFTKKCFIPLFMNSKSSLAHSRATNYYCKKLQRKHPPVRVRDRATPNIRQDQETGKMKSETSLVSVKFAFPTCPL